MHRLANRRRPYGRQPIPVVRNIAAPHVGELTHDGRPLGMHPFNHAAKGFHDGRVTEIQLPPQGGRINGHI